MFKMYLNGFYGQDPLAWESNWKGSDINEAIIFASYNNPYKVDFDKYCRPGMRIIEAGCGIGAFVISYAKKGCDIIGVDFARSTIDYLKTKIKDFPIEFASLENIPYPDNLFDVYLSIGVIEHFEEGPFKVLKEAYRIIKPNGYMILTVPWINACKQLKYKMDLNNYKEGNNTLLRFDENCYYESIDEFKKGRREDFYQYEFTKKEIISILKEMKFDVIHTHGISIAYGINYIPFFGYYFSAINKFIEKRKMKKNSIGQMGSKKGADTISFESIAIPPLQKGNSIKEFFKNIITREDTGNIIRYPIVRLLQEICGDFLLIVCKPVK